MIIYLSLRNDEVSHVSETPFYADKCQKPVPEESKAPSLTLDHSPVVLGFARYNESGRR